MGLCKCPKKKVTTLFCFEHRVNVCEHCLVSNHPRCIVQSYLQWLQDSDYNPNCQLCNRLLSDEDLGECVRLVCYDVYHWSCLDRFARQLPSNTAPAGYTCPQCKSGIFPAANNCTPVAESLKTLLSKVNWARAGLGLPLIEEPSHAAVPVTQTAVTDVHRHSDPPRTPQQSASASNTSYYSPLTPHQAYSQHAPASHQSTPTTTAVSGYSTQSYKSSHSVVNVDDSAPYNRASDKSTDYFPGSVPRKLFDARDDRLNTSKDHDEDKYKRRPALQWLFRWFKSTAVKGRRDPNANLKRICIIVILGMLAFVTLMLIMFRLGRSSADSDPFLDPMANPNIRINARN